jgi:hypothetical protein
VNKCRNEHGVAGLEIGKRFVGIALVYRFVHMARACLQEVIPARPGRVK